MSGPFLFFEITKCFSIQGEALITQNTNSYEFDIDGIRRVCVDSKTTKVIERNVFWDARNSSTMIPGGRAFIIKLTTRDNRIGFVTGSISQKQGDKPEDFRGSMYYLNDVEKTYQTSTIRFCKITTNCGKDIFNRIKAASK